ncbi:MAG TPA: RNA 3'-terminal phosphate cyclase [Sumerlaeia bacterium]|nr:RNA 3'-terminal phosphate cyclase [Sumerlaeia bacterium]
MIEIDGSSGEGGGQILRSSLALSLVTSRPFRIDNIRAGRKKPGLLRQHLTAVRAAQEVGDADVTGDAIGSRTLTFAPKGVRPGRYRFTVGTAGSCTLVLQTALPALLTAEGASELVLEGGTHNPYAPPFDFLDKAFLPTINRMGPRATASLERPGFYPAGGGRFTVRIEPAPRLERFDLLERGEIQGRLARAVVAQLPAAIARRELAVLRNALSWDETCLHVEEIRNSSGPGNVLIVEIQCENVVEVFTGFGQRGVPAERVAEETAQAVRQYLAADVPVGRHLADQLLIPMALAGGGRFRTLSPTRHTTTNVEVIKRFLDVEVALMERGTEDWEAAVGSS